MKIELDRAKCTGIGMCESVAPDYFEIDEGGELLLVREGASEADLATVEEAIRACPTAALTLLA